MTALAREQSRRQIGVGGELTAETAADLRRRHLYLRNGHLQERRHRIPNLKRSLGAGPDVNLIVGPPLHGRGLRLQVSLMDHRGCKLTLDNCVGCRVTGFQVAARVAEMLREVCRLIADFPHGDGAQLREENGRVVCHGLPHIQHRFEDLVLYIDQADSLLSDVDACRRHRGDGMAVVQDLVLRQHIGAQIPQIHRVLAHLLNFVSRFGQVRGGNDRGDAWQCLGFAGIDIQDTRVGMGAAQILAVQHSRHILVSGIAGRADNLIHTVVPNGPGPHHLVVSGHSRIAVLSHKSLLKNWLDVESRLQTPAIYHLRTIRLPAAMGLGRLTIDLAENQRRSCLPIYGHCRTFQLAISASFCSIAIHHKDTIAGT